MKTPSLALSTLLVFATGCLLSKTSTAREGGLDGGGGKGVVCRNHDGSIKSVELLDIWEARTIYSRKPLPVQGDLNAAVDAELVRLQNVYPDQGVEHQRDVLDELRGFASAFLAPDLTRVKMLKGVTLAPTNDSYEVAKPEGCDIAQIVDYQDNGLIYVSADLWNRMDKTNLAALVAHESLYAFLRQEARESNSIRTRRAVGIAASGQDFALNPPPPRPGNSRALICTSTPEGIYNVSPDKITLVDAGTVGHTDDGSNIMGVKVYVNALSGSSLMGVLPGGDYTFNSNFDYFTALSSGRCPTDNTYPMEAGFSPQSQVEYDRKITLDIKCSDGKISMATQNLAPGTSTAVSAIYSCVPAAASAK